ncbi:MAG: sensor histidine kinase [Thermoanaerobaculia bacterium]|nr:sensor histidine kinase [Thermoanaerobaculia bacterium]
MREQEAGSKGAEDVLRDWRGKAADLVIAASAIVHAPVLVPIVAGYGPLNARPARIAGVAAYMVIVAGAVFRGLDQRVRIWAMLGAIYGLAFVGALVLPQGPYIRALPLIPPLLAIGLLGMREARACTLLSAVLLMLAPLLQSIPGVVQWFGMDPAPVGLSPSQIWWPGAALTADLVVLMVLLERFYGFLQQAFLAERRAAEERAAASSKLQSETEERRRLESEIARTGDDERRRLGHEIHDGICQQLTGALLRCQALELRVQRGTALSAADLDALSSLLGETIHEARGVAQGLYPLEPVPDALAPALRALTRRTQHTSGLACEFRATGDLLVPDPVIAQHLYRITQEALSNAVCHAKAGVITVELSGGDDSLLLQVRDDGVGIPSTVPTGGMGLRTMAFRAQILRGSLAVQPAPGGGTLVTCRVPRLAIPPPENSGGEPSEGTNP